MTLPRLDLIEHHTVGDVYGLKYNWQSITCKPFCTV